MGVRMDMRPTVQRTDRRMRVQADAGHSPSHPPPTTPPYILFLSIAKPGRDSVLPLRSCPSASRACMIDFVYLILIGRKSQPGSTVVRNAPDFAQLTTYASNKRKFIDLLRDREDSSCSCRRLELCRVVQHVIPVGFTTEEK